MSEIAASRVYVVSEVRPRSRLVAADPPEVRTLDAIGAVLLLILFGPLMVLVAIGVFVSDPGPVVFRQKRIGRGGHQFDCLKFRTMTVDAEHRLAHLLANDPIARAEWDRDQKLRKDPRIVGIGHFLRKSSLDELPQLFNVLRGEMSLVGPRPIVAEEIGRYGRYFSHYCAVRPGITGLWQISGRNDVDYRRRVAFDVIYARKGTAMANVKILLLTVPSVVASRGSY
ncbi:sugar transferase [Sphingomonas ursincola]|uniref:Sugar transferase n=1 Tax=Sphingomonas ursincola TaxID=56361 RepID=A0A7V8RCH8_9SPHN|nr:sugar transferase [Sphingomonas ursincola]MBA1373921.1 sugar transferase [Sphingomonas ursincola]